jgi:hypothetical protein
LQKRALQFAQRQAGCRWAEPAFFVQKPVSADSVGAGTRIAARLISAEIRYCVLGQTDGGAGCEASLSHAFLS